MGYDDNARYSKHAEVFASVYFIRLGAELAALSMQSVFEFRSDRRMAFKKDDGFDNDGLERPLGRELDLCELCDC